MRKLKTFITVRFTLIGFFVLLSIPWGSSLYKKPFIEDAWYGFSIARNIADGFGITIDGSQQTNGFQPLQVFIDSIIFTLTKSDNVALIIIFTSRLLLHITSAYIFEGILKKALSGREIKGVSTVGFAVYLFNPAIIPNALNGLETGLVLLVFLLFIKVNIKGDLYAYDITIFRGVVLYGTILIYARIDMYVVVVTFLLLSLLKYNLLIVFKSGVSIFVLTLPWFLYNYLNFASFMPISGQQQQDLELSAFRLTHLVKAITFNLSPWVGSSYSQSDLNLEIILAFLRGICLFWIATVIKSSLKRHKKNPIPPRLNLVIIAITISLTILSIYYLVATFATWFYPRYTSLFAPLMLLLLFLIVDELKRRQKVTALFALLISGCVFYTGYHSKGFENGLFQDQVKLVLETVPLDEIVGARQSGTLGYNRGRVVNLDGKVNPIAPRDKISMEQYLKANSIDYLCDWPSELDKIISSHRVNWEIVASSATVKCMKRVDAG